jgi:DNA-directed RNA polymerase subunit RPC12/RpoP
MYKTLSRNLQRLREKTPRVRKRGFPGKHKIGQAGQRIDRGTADDIKKFRDPTYLPKLGGWPLERFARLHVNMSMVCKNCGHRTEPLLAQCFGRVFGKSPAGAQLIKLKKMLRCPKCNGAAVYIQINIG